MNIAGLADTLIDDPKWTEKALGDLSKVQKAALRKALLAIAKTETSDNVMAVLAHFTDDEVVSFRKKILARKTKGSAESASPTIKAVIEKLLEEPWSADDHMRPLSKADKVALRNALLARAKTDPSRALMEVLGQFADDEVVSGLKKVLASKARDSVKVGAAEGLANMKTRAAQAVLHTLVAHDDDTVARIAIENVQDKPAGVLKLLLPIVDRIAKRGDDLLMKALVEKLVEAAPTNRDVISALAKHWEFQETHQESGFASNAIFDALIEHAPDSPVAQRTFAAAAASEHAYGKVRGHAALALTSPDFIEHVRVLRAMKGLDSQCVQLRVDALALLKKNRKRELQKLAKAADRTAASLLR